MSIISINLAFCQAFPNSTSANDRTLYFIAHYNVDCALSFTIATLSLPIIANTKTNHHHFSSLKKQKCRNFSIYLLLSFTEQTQSPIFFLTWMTLDCFNFGKETHFSLHQQLFNVCPKEWFEQGCFQSRVIWKLSLWVFSSEVWTYGFRESRRQTVTRVRFAMLRPSAVFIKHRPESDWADFGVEPLWLDCPKIISTELPHPEKFDNWSWHFYVDHSNFPLLFFAIFIIQFLSLNIT